MTRATGGSDQATAARSRPARGLLLVLDIYRAVISPRSPANCRYLPSCSEYAVEAVCAHGAARGAWLAARRISRCHPLHAGGYDPVPPVVAKARTRVTGTASV